jgi:hypothetical protein
MRAMRLNSGQSLYWLGSVLTLTLTLSLQMLKRNKAPVCSNAFAVTVVTRFGLLANG